MKSENVILQKQRYLQAYSGANNLQARMDASTWEPLMKNFFQYLLRNPGRMMRGSQANRVMAFRGDNYDTKKRSPSYSKYCAFNAVSCFG